MFAGMTSREIYRHYLEALQDIYSKGEAAVIADWVFEKITGLRRADIVKHPFEELESSKKETLDHCLAGLLQHTPVQYVLEEAWFYKMKLYVNEQVLIPRPETEELVKLVIDDYKNITGDSVSVDSPLMLDIGTGSGCIAIAVKKNLPGIALHAIDISEGALAVAKKNAHDQKVGIEFTIVNFLNEQNWQTLPLFDVIISNPPYIPVNDKVSLDKNVVAFEPATALFVPDDQPLLFYEKIAAFGKTNLRNKGRVYTEIHEDFGEAARTLFEENYIVEIKKDIFGKDRMLVASLRVIE